MGRRRLPAHPAALRALGAGDPAGARHRRLRHRPPAEPGAARGLQPAPPGLSRRPLNRLDSSPENEVRAGSRRLEDLTDGSKAVPLVETLPPGPPVAPQGRARKRVVAGKSVSVLVALGGRRSINKKK